MERDKRAIGDTGLAVTPIAFGTSALGNMPDTYGYEVDEARARATLDAIFAGPANVIDTSRNYGLGESEARIGAVIAQRGALPRGFVLSTKIDRDMETNRLDAARARRSVEESLTALNVDHVDILFLHDPEHCADLEEIVRPGGALTELFKLKDEKVATAVGLAMGKLSVMEPIVADWPFDAIINHNRYTLLNREADRLFNHCAKRSIAVFNAAPYASGVLAKGADAMPLITYMPADDEALAPVRALEAVCARYGVPLGAAALQFSMRDPRITSTIVGVTKPERVAQTFEWAEFPIPEPCWTEIMALPFSSADPEANRVYRPG